MRISGKDYSIELSFSRFLYLASTKIGWIPLILRFFIKETPHRFRRIIVHFKHAITSLSQSKEDMLNRQNRIDFIKWNTKFFFYLFDLFGGGEIYQFFAMLFKFNTRPLTRHEVDIARNVYGDSINYSLIRIDELALIAPKQLKVCYVGFYTINSWGRMSNAVLVHELIHIWQYERMGSVYIPKALRDQRTTLGYNYGGVSFLKNNMYKSLWDMNLEQQGDLVADYFRIVQGYEPKWGIAKLEDLPYYEPFISEIKST